MAVSGAEEGVAILAREQTAGRGSKGRSWASPAGQGLYLSVILRPALTPPESTVLTLASAIAVAETLRCEFNVTPDIKWPNDVLISGRKVCGILVESATERGQLQYAIVGIGVNVSQNDFGPELAGATSLLIENSRRAAPEDVLSPLLDHLDRWYRVSISSTQEILAKYQELSSYARDCRVRVIGNAKEFEGITRGLTETGALLVEHDGRLRTVVSGEIQRLRAGNDRLSSS
jgi:BirA family biotin operon repressor/biotin-[acetyl-CoA-carboxylase] ligase